MKTNTKLCAILAVCASVLALCASCSTDSTAQAAKSSHARSNASADAISKATEPDDNGDDSAIPSGARKLLEVYPDCIKGYEDGKLVMASGKRIAYDDGRKKDFVTMLDESDPEDMFSMTYDREAKEPAYLNDAGRSRCEALFKEMYGHTAAEAQSRLRTVNWFGQKLRFSKVNGAAAQLEKVAAEIARHADLRRYMEQSSTFYWRAVRGAKRQSAHSYGIAIDVCTKYADYWLWKNGANTPETARIVYANRIPQELVEIFEKYGFIWGGRWYHYDTMHFEYRPEFL